MFIYSNHELPLALKRVFSYNFLPMNNRHLIVTHHSPDLDAIGACWLLKRFDAVHYADAKIAFVNPGDQIRLEEAEKFGFQLHEITYVDTGLSEFDHHQPNRAIQFISASSLVRDYIIKIHPEYQDDKTLKELIDLITEIDHFGEVHWPDCNNNRYVLMIHEIIRGIEFVDPHNDDTQLNFGLKCLDYAYAALKQSIKADEVIAQKGIEFEIKIGKCIAILTRNDDTIKRAQKMGYVLVIRKDSSLGHIRIKVRPDVKLYLDQAYTKIKEKDRTGSWFFHPNRQMLINGSRKHHRQTASPLKLEEVIDIMKECYA